MSALAEALRDAEWLEADGAGGFASGTVGGRRTRRYHALLCTATTPPTGRVVLVNGIEAFLLDSDGATRALSTQRYAPGVDHPDGDTRITGFESEPFPSWRFRTEAGTQIAQDIMVDVASGATLLRWRVLSTGAPLSLRVRLLLSGRDYHSLRREDAHLDLTPSRYGETLVWTLGDGLPSVAATPFGAAGYEHDPVWYRNFEYEAERRRGLDHGEDLASPGVHVFALSSAGETAGLALRAVAPGAAPSVVALSAFDEPRAGRARRAAAAYVVRSAARQTIIAGYPWFTDWGRDTFIAMRGLCLALGRLDEALGILLDWAATVDEGMLPNRFPDGHAAPEFNAVDASLWFVIAAHDTRAAFARAGRTIGTDAGAALDAAVDAIIDGYRAGTRFAIRMDEDGLIAAGVPGLQLTWMDAKVGDHVVTPRIGKPVEIQALWINALAATGGRRPELAALAARATASFRERFWNETTGTLYDVVDVDHEAGRVDASFRPNQIFAVGGLPLALLHGADARRVLHGVAARLLTPFGLRTLAPGEPGYTPAYGGDPWQRDTAYHQGTVWPWLIGPFVEAWLAAHRDTRYRLAKTRAMLAPLVAYRDGIGLGHVFEVADAEAPHTPGGCPAQAWSLGELIRAERLAAGEDWRDPPRPKKDPR